MEPHDTTRTDPERTTEDPLPDGGTPTEGMDQSPADATASAPTLDLSLRGTLSYLWEVDRWGIVTLALFLLAAGMFLYRLPGLVGSGGLDNFATVVFQHLWTFGILLALTFFTRTVSIRTLVAYWLVGVLFVANLVLFLGGLVTGALGTSWVTGAFLLPLLEEFLKLLPVAVFLFLSIRQGGWERTVSDALLLGFAVGAGFAFAEEMLAGRSVGHGFGDGIWGLLFPTFAKLGGGFFGGPIRWTMAHAGWTALAALGLGVAVTFRHRKLLWPVPFFAFGLITLDHMVVNGSGGVANLLDVLLFRGKVPMWIFLAAVPLVVVADFYAIRRTTRQLGGHFDPIYPTQIRELLVGPKDALTLMQLKSVANYSRWRRSGILAIRRYRIGATGEDRLPAIEAIAGWLLTMRRAADPALRGDPDPAPGGYGLSPDAMPDPAEPVEDSDGPEEGPARSEEGPARSEDEDPPTTEGGPATGGSDPLE